MCQDVLDDSLGKKHKKWLKKIADHPSTFRKNFSALLDLVQEAISVEAMEHITKEDKDLIKPMQAKAIAFIVNKMKASKGMLESQFE